eukprot:TRINITY_DN19991_c0_g1_i4.p1 TRINITY_DN19991_c0_g1~~TRINITY_DN19991_c0_g1_i4.p1  ORF type:complete len:392 (+),score=56.92 TRINITY_DN19991_c0_g1_i4:191-1366(+)
MPRVSPGGRTTRYALPGSVRGLVFALVAAAAAGGFGGSSCGVLALRPLSDIAEDLLSRFYVSGGGTSASSRTSPHRERLDARRSTRAPEGAHAHPRRADVDAGRRDRDARASRQRRRSSDGRLDMSGAVSGDHAEAPARPPAISQASALGQRSGHEQLHAANATHLAKANASGDPEADADKVMASAMHGRGSKNVYERFIEVTGALYLEGKAHVFALFGGPSLLRSADLDGSHGEDAEATSPKETSAKEALLKRLPTKPIWLAHIQKQVRRSRWPSVVFVLLLMLIFVLGGIFVRYTHKSLQLPRMGLRSVLCCALLGPCGGWVAMFLPIDESDGSAKRPRGGGVVGKPVRTQEDFGRGSAARWHSGAGVAKRYAPSLREEALLRSDAFHR